MCAGSQFPKESHCVNCDPTLIASIPLFRTIGQAESARIAKVTQTLAFSKRQLVVEKNTTTQGLWILIEGRLQGVDYTIDGREVGLYFITPGDFFGELALIDQNPQPEHVIATAASKVLAIPRQISLDLMRLHPEIATQIAKTLAGRVRALIKQRTLLTLTTPMQRLAAQLIDLASIEGDTIQVSFIPTHQEIAMMINASRETVTRAFRKLQTQGIVVRDGHRLILQQKPRLDAIAKGDQDELE